MYEENIEPLPPGNISEVFAPVFSKILGECDLSKPGPTSHEEVLFWANTELQNHLASISRRLLLPGSSIDGVQNLKHLIKKSAEGSSCILCLNHRSNLDVPTLGAMLHDHSLPQLFEKIIWIAGRKLQEDPGMTGMLVQAYNRVIVTPRSWLRDNHSQNEVHEAHLINIAAHRTIHDLRHQGWVFALFPTGTRIRPGKVSTTRAIPETDGYLKSFEYMMLGKIKGCTLPVTRDQDLTRETPQLDRMSFNFGDVIATDSWRKQAARRHPELSQRAASARAIMEDIEALGGERNDQENPP